MDAATRAALYERTRGYCDVCGGVLAEADMAAHHRKTRGQGGRWGLANLLGIHHACHNGATGSIHLHPRRALDNGYLVASWDDPRTVPVWLHHDRWVLLTDAGEVVGYLEDPKED